jgi:hypothetical protein
MTREDQEEPGIGANGLVLRNGRLDHLRALFPAALADEADSLSWLIAPGELPTHLFDPLVHLAEVSLVPGTPILHGPQAPFFHRSSVVGRVSGGGAIPGTQPEAPDLVEDMPQASAAEKPTRR